MSANRKTTRMNLFKRSIEVKQQDLQFKLKQMNTALEKIHQTIRTLNDYIKNYKKTLHSQALQSPTQFVNYQSFLDQLAKSRQIEQDEQNRIIQKKEAILNEIKQNTHKIDVIDQVLSRYHQSELQEKNNKTEQIELEQWLVHSNVITDKVAHPDGMSEEQPLP